jgi:SAM-dependent methyltransferase
MNGSAGTNEPAPLPGFRHPMSGPLLVILARGLGLRAEDRVLDICCGHGGGAMLLAREVGVRVTAVDPSPESLRLARGIAREQGLADRVEFLEMDPSHLRLPAEAFQAVLALGGICSLLGAVRALEQLRVHVAPGGWLLLSDPVYLSSPVPAPARRLLDELDGPEGKGLAARENPPDPTVRAILEQGRYTFESEAGYRGLLEATGYEVEFSVLVPETEWGEYFARMAREAGEADSPLGDREARVRVAQEAAAYYAYGGRGTVGYLIAGARRPRLDEDG